MKTRKKLNIKRFRRAARVSAKFTGTPEKPRLVVHRTNRFLYAQLIDDTKGHTIAAVTTKGMAAGKGAKATKTVQAVTAGEALAKAALAKGVKTAVFDRRSSKFHGRVKGFAEGAKKGGLKI